MLGRLRHRGHRGHSGFAHWATLVVLVLATLAPTVSRAVQVAQGNIAPWSVICSAADAGAQGGADSRGDLQQLFEHCPYCSLQLPDLAAPPAPPRIDLRPAVAGEAPPLCLRAPHALAVWACAQARAPPHTS